MLLRGEEQELPVFIPSEERSARRASRRRGAKRKRQETRRFGAYRNSVSLLGHFCLAFTVRSLNIWRTRDQPFTISHKWNASPAVKDKSKGRTWQKNSSEKCNRYKVNHTKRSDHKILHNKYQSKIINNYIHTLFNMHVKASHTLLQVCRITKSPTTNKFTQK